MSRHKTRVVLGTVLAAGSIALAGCGGGGFDDSNGDAGGELTSSEDSLTLLMGSSGDAETNAVREQVAAWSKESGVDVEVKLANDLPQQLSQGFAAGTPADIFYLSTDAIAGYAKNGSLKAYGDQLGNKDDFYPALLENYTIDDEVYCAPKDFGALALIINDDMWAQAGLTDDDVPTTWDELAEVAAKLTADGRVGLAFGSTYNSVGVFMEQAGGGLLKDGKVIADSPENVEALEYVASHLDDGRFGYYTAIGATWGGESLGNGLAAMVVEGPWITGAMAKDYPDINYSVVELPEGPGGKGTFQFTNCWGMAADSPNQKATLDLIEYLTTPETQLAFSEAFGPIPSVKSAASDWTAVNPELEAFLAGAEYASFMPNMDGANAVVADFDAELESLKTADPKKILDTVQQNLSAIVE